MLLLFDLVYLLELVKFGWEFNGVYPKQPVMLFELL